MIMIAHRNGNGAAHQLGRALQGLEPVERLVMLTVWTCGWGGVVVSLEDILQVTGLEDVEAAKACLLLLIRGFLVPSGEGPWDFLFNPERLP